MPTPSHPSDGNEPISDSMSRRNRVLLAFIAAAALVVVALHLTGVIGPG